MARLEELTVGVRAGGVVPGSVVTIKSVGWTGNQAVEVIYEDVGGRLDRKLLFRDDEHQLEVVTAGRPWSFEADGHLFRLVSEANRIRLAWLFDPYVAITTSPVDPLPHQISAVYEEMLPKLPLRFLLADDPGAGKTIMAGLLIKELLLRGDLERCLIVAPGSLTDQWQDELEEKFGLSFKIFGRDMISRAHSGNPFAENHLLIARMDQLSRSDELQASLRAAPEWDLVVCDEAHRMSAHVGAEGPEPTRRYQLGKVVGNHTRNFLLMTATPHNGIEADFQCFLQLLDNDRFEGRFREGVHTIDPSDIMRRMVKEEMRTFEGKNLFPERRSHTLQYDLSPNEATLYAQVTDYVREEMNRAERVLPNARRVNVGFALMTLQRRLASSPRAIHRSIERRRERLETRLREERLLLRGRGEGEAILGVSPTEPEQRTWNEWDDVYDEADQDEREGLETQVIDHATAARTVEELATEIEQLRQLETLAKSVASSGDDAKWSQLSEILDDPLMVDDHGNRRKLVIFTEFRDTLTYLAERVRNRLGRPEAVVEIHGGVHRQDRRQIVHEFMNNPEVLILVANDAAGEGVNLQRAHLMVNYDLPWNPNRLEQRFGRIHRIKQTEVCHLWNLLAKDTREGDVYFRLLRKLEVEREALGGDKVFDVLGRLFDQKPLRDILWEAIRLNNDPAVRARLDQVVDGVVDKEHLARVFEQRALVSSDLDTRKIHDMRIAMQRAEALRLQPHFVQAFFEDAFTRLGGKVAHREPGRFEITHVPADVRDRNRALGAGTISRRYERICFDKARMDGPPAATIVAPGTALLDSTIDLIVERFGELLKLGAVLVDEDDPGTTPRLLFYVHHSVQDGRRTKHGRFQVISERLLFLEAMRGGSFRTVGAAPYLNYRPVTAGERTVLGPELDAEWLRRDWEKEVVGHAITTLVPEHLREVKAVRLPLIDKIEQQVNERLQKEINYWDHRAEDLRAQERAGKKTKLPAHVASERAEKLAERQRARRAALQLERNLSAQPPSLRGGALVIPIGLLRELRGDEPAPGDVVDYAARRRVEELAMLAVMRAEEALGRNPRDVSHIDLLGYDIESLDPRTGDLYFIEVKGRGRDAITVCLQRSQLTCALNKPDHFRLAICVIENDAASHPVYLSHFDFGQPVFAQTSAEYALATILGAGREPH